MQKERWRRKGQTPSRQRKVPTSSTQVRVRVEYEKAETCVVIDSCRGAVRPVHDDALLIRASFWFSCLSFPSHQLSPPVRAYHSFIQPITTGLQRWEEVRSLWLKKTEAEGTGPSRTAISIDVDEIIDIIISNRWRDAPTKSKGGGNAGAQGCSFSHPIPLPQMIDLLTDLWEAEGLEM